MCSFARKKIPPHTASPYQLEEEDVSRRGGLAVFHSVHSPRRLIGLPLWPFRGPQNAFFTINEKDSLTLKSGAVTCTKQESAGVKVMWSEDACGWGDKGGVSVRVGE